uniref:Putative reverse transcriptase domain-containing protein n=1 Tax=Tanacetum cinerariifolium TaxID=118510 RepID=A0A699HKZ6_TANCI|nr:putative reverse transcriptase domain-containing protein [Tanacetum cinerariifolium]
MEPDFSNMTLNEYLMYHGRHKDLERSYTSRKSVTPTRNKILVYPVSDEEDEDYYSLPPLLPCFKTLQPYATLKPVHHNNHSEVDIESMTLEEYARYKLAMSTIRNETHVPTQENIRKMEHEVPNRCDNITDYEDSDQELKEVRVEEVEMDKDFDIDHSNTKEAIQRSLAHDPFLVVLEPDVQSSFLLRTIPSSISNEVKREFKIPHRTFRVIIFIILGDEWKSFQSQHQTALRKIVTIWFTHIVLSALRRLGIENKQCLRKVADGHFTTAVKVLSFTGVAPYCDDTIKALEAKNYYKSPPSMPNITFFKPLLIAEIDSVFGCIKSFPKGGAKTLLHGVNRVLSEYHNDGSLAMLTMDLSNAFNLVDRSALLHEETHISGLPLCCKLLLHAWYLGDGTIIGDSEEVARVLDIIKVSGPCLGLELNIKKTEIFWLSCNGIKLWEGLFHVNIQRHAEISAKKEAHVNFLTDTSDERFTLRPVDVLVFGWVGGKHACVDLTEVSPLVGLSSWRFTAGQAALKAASCKVTKHKKACIENQNVFIPFAFDTFGFLTPEAVELVIRVHRVMHNNVMTHRSTDVVFKRIGFAIQKGLAAQLVARLPSTIM